MKCQSSIPFVFKKILSDKGAPKYRDVKYHGIMQLSRLVWMWNVGDDKRKW